ncbi:bZIP transcription factor 2-like isoform X2 [Olea europaea var. sylvestris]|uniref:bZIP transcription factor 2-like isoform X2 n=1 Tax=Olea europaea var. sylvestris TaxID=158386 RepID=UPI000C1D66A9|nr:bZIP transcription factor 2-like isoform X2 [Olea europaea var. sylvestris]
MLSTFPASESFFGNPFPTFESGFTPWDSQEPPSFFSPPPKEPVKPPQEPVISKPGSDNSKPRKSGSFRSKNLISGSGKTKRSGDIIDDRKRRRMISNRESARRSRMRKQKDLESLRDKVSRFRIGNQELMNRLRLISYNDQIIRRENDRLRSESVVLRQRLWDIRQILLVRQLQQQLNSSSWPCNNINGEHITHQSIIS